MAHRSQQAPTHARFRPLNVVLDPASRAELVYYARSTLPAEPEARVPGIKASPAHDLRYQGGKILPDLTFTNLYVGGANSWATSDRENIDQALAAAMSDQHLNNVMLQYFAQPAITTTFKPSTILPGSPPSNVSQGDTEQMLKDLYAAGKLAGYDLATTVFCFMLPRGTVLTDDPAPSGQASASEGAQAKEAKEAQGKHGRVRMADKPEFDEAADSLNGLGGYHGSIHPDQATPGLTLYYAVGVYSELRAGGTPNGIPVFDQSWKNVVATFYHELNEARTDADVEDANQSGVANPVSLLGWISRKGEEVGDFPVFEARPLTQVFQEVKLTDGSGTVPVQFMYSDAVHGPEGPIATPHPSIFPAAKRAPAHVG